MPRPTNPRPFINRAVVQRGVREERARRMRELGRTRWGQAWLGALHAVDEESRLGRGLEYARQGAVEGVEFLGGGRVRSRVRGSARGAYTVQLSLKPVTGRQVDALLRELARRPDWLDLLLSGQLPAGLERVLAQVRLRLFPSSWRDLGMACSCPDAAVPCKHIAAVLYRLAQYIDEDPTLLFAVRGLDLARAVSRLGDLSDLAPVSLRALREDPGERPLDEYGEAPIDFLDDAEARGVDALAPASSTTGGASDANSAGDADGAVAAIPALLDYWRLLLPARPPWFDGGGDLTELYHNYLAAAAGFWRDRGGGDDAADADVEGDGGPAGATVAAFGLPDVYPWQVADVAVVLDAAGGFAEARLLGRDGETLHAFTKEVALLAFAERGGRHVAVLDQAYRLARALVQRGAVVPRMLHLDGDRYRVRWEAATQDPEVARAVRGLADAADPRRRVRYRELGTDDEALGDYRARLGRELAAEMDGESAPPAPGATRYLAPRADDAVHALLSVFLRPMLLAGVEQVFAKAEHPAVQLLFLGRPVDLTATSGDANLALGLQLWLRRLRLDTADYRLVVQVDEVPDKPGGYTLRLLLVDETAEAPAPLPVTRAIEGALGEVRRLQVLRDVALLAEAYEPFGAYVVTDGREAVESLRLYGGDFAHFLFQVAPALRLVGAQLLLPHGLERAARPKLSAVLVAKGEVGDEPGKGGDDGEAGAPPEERPKGYLGMNSLVGFDWRVAVGDEHIDPDEFALLAEQYEGIVRLRDGFVWLEPEHTERLLRRLTAPPQPAPQVTTQALLTGQFQGAPLFLSDEVRRLREQLLSTRLPESARLEGLRATLRPYQEVGFAWLLRNAEAGLGSLLADDMGLGKTLQTIALLEHYRALGRWRDEGPALVVLPTSLITNWQRELARFAPELEVATYHGPGRALKHTRGAEVVLTSYGVVRSDGAKLHRVAWGALVIDEAQQIKNDGAQQTAAVKELDAPIRIALSGTPVENRLAEYWSVLDFANPGYLGPLPQFKATYADPIEQDRDPARLAMFRQVTAPFILRRLKTDRSVIDDLPEKITQLEPVPLEREQAALYQQVVDTQVRELAAAEPHERRGRMLKFMTAVKQVCNHPHHYLKRGTRDAAASGKSLRLIELVEAALAGEERVLVFTQYREMGELLVDMLRERFGFAPPFLHGGLTRDERDAMVAGLQDGSGPPVLLLSIKAGGTGLNLTAANHVVHYDLWWNPAVESQATDRAFRIGQRRNVHVHRLVCAGTFEERIDQMLAQKRELADLTVAEGGAWLGDLAEEVLAGVR